jgi:hypothetical protein
VVELMELQHAMEATEQTVDKAISSGPAIQSSLTIRPPDAGPFPSLGKPCLLCARRIASGEPRLELETESHEAIVTGSVCRLCVAEAVLEAIARRVAGEGRMDHKPGTDGADQNIDARTIDAVGAGSAPADGEIPYRG